MALSDTQQADVTRRLNALCEARVPPAARGEVRVGFRMRGAEVILFEERPGFQPPEEWREQAVAKFRYVGTRTRACSMKWQLIQPGSSGASMGIWCGGSRALGATRSSGPYGRVR